MAKKRCHNCFWWRSDNWHFEQSIHNNGDCRLSPPSATYNWAHTNENDYCGSFKHTNNFISRILKYLTKFFK